MEAIAPFAKEVIGIEEEEEWVKTAANKGFGIYHTDAFFHPLPKADVYYLWNKAAMGIFLKAKWEGTKGTFVFGKTVRPSLTKFLKDIKAERRDLPELDWWVYVTEL